MSQCDDYRAGALDGARGRNVREACAVVHGVFSSEPCPKDSTWIGSCDVGAVEVRRYYSQGGTPFAAESAERSCAVAEGAWRAR